MIAFFICSDGQKMSKRLKNYPDPVTVVNRFGADALRLDSVILITVLFTLLSMTQAVLDKFTCCQSRNTQISGAWCERHCEGSVSTLV